MSVAFAPRLIHAVVGQNGAGKTTFARVAAGLVKPRLRHASRSTAARCRPATSTIARRRGRTGASELRLAAVLHRRRGDGVRRHGRAALFTRRGLEAPLERSISRRSASGAAPRPHSRPAGRDAAGRRDRPRAGDRGEGPDPRRADRRAVANRHRDAVRAAARPQGERRHDHPHPAQDPRGARDRRHGDGAPRRPAGRGADRDDARSDARELSRLRSSAPSREGPDRAATRQRSSARIDPADSRGPWPRPGPTPPRPSLLPKSVTTRPIAEGPALSDGQPRHRAGRDRRRRRGRRQRPAHAGARALRARRHPVRPHRAGRPRRDRHAAPATGGRADCGSSRSSATARASACRARFGRTGRRASCSRRSCAQADHPGAAARGMRRGARSLGRPLFDHHAAGRLALGRQCAEADPCPRGRSTTRS